MVLFTVGMQCFIQFKTGLFQQRFDKSMVKTLR